MNLSKFITDEESLLYVESLPAKQARHVEWRRTQTTPCPIIAWCTGCHSYQPITRFYLLSVDNTHGRKTILKEKRHSTCKDCQSQRYQDTAYTRKLLYAARRRATTRQIEFDLTEEDIVIPEYCPILGLKLQPVRGVTGRDSSPSLDRIDNSKGYVKGNVAVISFRANTLKNNATADELRAIANFMDEAMTEPKVPRLIVL